MYWTNFPFESAMTYVIERTRRSLLSNLIDEDFHIRLFFLFSKFEEKCIYLTLIWKRKERRLEFTSDSLHLIREERNEKQNQYRYVGIQHNHTRK